MKHLPPRGYLPVVSFRVGVTCAFLTVCLVGCGEQVIQAVGRGDGEAGPPQQCPAVADTTSSLGFESPGDAGRIVPDMLYTSVSSAVVSSTRSHCGTSSLAVDVYLTWMSPAPDTTDREAALKYTFDPPVDLLGHTVSFWIFADGPPLPQQAQIGVDVQPQPGQPPWHPVDRETLDPGWNRISGTVSGANPLTQLDPAASSIDVTDLKLDFFIPSTVLSGDRGNWSGTIYIDDIAW